MAVGFKLSDVIDLSFSEDEPDTIVFTKKSIVYKILFDDVENKHKLIKMIQSIQDPKVPKPKEKVKESFYLDESKLQNGKKTE